jgi:hypothetical protein
MGDAGRTLVESEFSWTFAVKETIRLYERLLEAA